MRAAISTLVLATFLLVPAPAQSQDVESRAAPPRPDPSREIIIYRDRDHSGPAVSIRHDQSNLGLVWTVNSALVRGGEWQLCERQNFQGPCLTVSRNQNNLGHRRVQSARLIERGWREIGRTGVYRLGWVNATIDARGQPALSELRFCAENTAIRFHHARVRFGNGIAQTIRVPSQVNSGRCSNPIALPGSRRNVRSVEVTASSVGVARGRIRLEGRDWS